MSVFERGKKKLNKLLSFSLSLFRKYSQVLAGMLTHISLMAVAVETSILVKVRLYRESGIFFGINVIDGILSLYINGDSEISCGDYPNVYNDDSKAMHGTAT